MQECVLATHIACMFENMSKWGNHTFCFRNHLRCFKVQLTPCVKSTRATTTLAGLQFSTPRKDVTNRSRLMWQLIFIWQAKSAPTTQANSSTHALITIFSHRTWAWDITRHPDVRFGNTWSGRMERLDSGNSQATMKELSDVSEMKWSVYRGRTNNIPRSLLCNYHIIKMFDYFFIISYIL
jgi:hypothetical protein